MEDINKLRAEFGNVFKDGKEYILTQDAYIDGVWEETYYAASAIDKDGRDYLIRWEILEDYDPTSQYEETACDWENPSEIIQTSGWVEY